MKQIIAVTMLLLILAGCTPVAANIPPPRYLPSTDQMAVPASRYLSAIDTAAVAENPSGIYIECKQGMVGCIGQTIPWGVGGALPVPQAYVQAVHEGDGAFTVRLGFADQPEQLLFQATGVYTSPEAIVTTTNILTMTVQATGPWKVKFQRTTTK